MTIDSGIIPAPAPIAQPAAPATSSSLATMHPAYFAMVMATGIVSVASQLLEFRIIARAMFFLNIAFYAALWVLTITRCIRYPKKVQADLLHHGRSVGFFTTVAATCVLGSQFLIVGGMWSAAAVLWCVGIVLWIATTHGIITLLTVKENKPGLAEGINGGWLLPVVAAQSVAVLGAQLSAGFSAAHQPYVLFFCVVVWLGAGMLYVWIISLIFYRYTFFPLNPSDLAPPYWINMGAVAISTLAGTMLLAAAPRSPLLVELTPFIKGLTLLFWSTATLWVPMLVLLGIWRHLYKRFPLRYDPLYWGAVFPLGMYTACTYRVTQVMHTEELLFIPRTFIYVALAAWTLTFIGLARSLVKSLFMAEQGARHGV
jgi:tellurite resistance protein TehA-like permease